MIVESCCTSLDEARLAQERGADRIELCTDLSVGGLTPSHDLIQKVISHLTIPVNILIRPSRHLDFVYDAYDIRQMLEDIAFCQSAGAAGIVVGALTPEGGIDVDALRRLVAAAAPLPVTFHRAYDVATEDPFEALEKIIAAGCTRLLTSGRAATAWDGHALIARLVEAAAGRLVILAGRGVTPANLPALAQATGAPEFHGTALP